MSPNRPLPTGPSTSPGHGKGAPVNSAEKLRQYANLIVTVGLNLQLGQRLLIDAPIEAAPLVRELAGSAYRAGSPLVEVLWDDEGLTLARFRHAPRDSFREFPGWRIDASVRELRSGSAYLWISAQDPDLLADQDENLVAVYRQTIQKQSKPLNDLVMDSLVNWCVAAAPVRSWAARVFPQLAPQRQLEALWEAIFAVCRLGSENPNDEWEHHILSLQARAEYLTAKGYARLRYRGPGTDLTVGLPRNHVWVGARSLAKNGVSCVPNIPTEEVFTLPHREQVDGEITVTKPLCYSGQVVTGARLVFKKGKVSRVEAEHGESFLWTLIETDDGASRLGEVAIVPEQTPLAQSGLLFYNTLFDENASCHFALGNSYRESLKEGSRHTDADFLAAGGNESNIHIDFMVGSNTLSIDGITFDGRVEAILRNGEWAIRS